MSKTNRQDAQCRSYMKAKSNPVDHDEQGDGTDGWHANDKNRACPKPTQRVDKCHDFTQCSNDATSLRGIWKLLVFARIIAPCSSSTRQKCLHITRRASPLLHKRSRG